SSSARTRAPPCPTSAVARSIESASRGGRTRSRYSSHCRKRKSRPPVNSRRGRKLCCNTASGALPTLRRRLPPLPARILLRVCMPISPSAARPTPRHDRRRIGTAPPTSRGNSLRPPSALAAAGAAFAITDDALDHVAGADVEIVVDAYAGSTGTGEESGEVPGDQRLTSAAGAARQRTADAAGREAAIDDAGRAAHRIVRIVEAGGETG